MNTEKLEKLKKSLDNQFIPDNMKDKIRAEIKKLEADIKTDDTITATEVKEEVKEIEKKVEKALEVAEKKEEQAEAKAPAKTRTKRTTTSRTKKPKVEEKPTAKKKTFTAIAKEIRKAGESWEDAKLRARKMMKSETTEIKKKTRTETDKLLAMVRRNKEYKKLAGTSNLSKDAQRRAMPRGKRVSKTGNVYYENRANRVDVGGFKSAYLETGGTIIGTPETPLVRDLGISYTGLVGETGAMSSGEMFADGGSIYKLKRINVDNQEIFDKGYFDWQDETFLTKGKALTLKEANDAKNQLEKISDAFKYKVVKVGENEKLADGGSTGLPEGTQQHFVNYYLGEGTAQGIYAEGGGVKKRSLKSVIHLVDWKGEGIKKWYLRSYPTDEMGEELNDTVTFKDLWDSLNAKKNVYEIMGVGDSLIRERLFEYLSLIYNVDYDVVYNKWLESADYAKGGGVRMVGNREYPTGRAWTNEHRHIDKADSREVNYTRKKSFDGGGGIEDNAPSVYIADLEAYNNGRLVGKWFNLLDYSDADEFNEAVADFLKETGAEEYAVHDFENIPRSMQSEYLGVKDFEEIYEMIDLARDKDLPLEVVMEVVSQYDASAVDNFYGVYDSEEDFAQQLVDDLGIESLNNFEYYLEISDTDRRLLAQDMADSYVDDIKYEDGGNRLIEEAGLDVEEYEEADEDRQEEMRDEATEIVYDQYYDTWYDGLDDPYYFLVEEQGLYSADDFAKASFVRVDIEKLARELEYDYNFIKYDGLVYVFSFR